MSETMHGAPAEFRVEAPAGEEIASNVCEHHLAEAVRAVNVDFDAEATVSVLAFLTNRDDDGTCQWAGDENAYKEVVREREARDESWSTPYDKCPARHSEVLPDGTCADCGAQRTRRETFEESRQRRGCTIYCPPECDRIAH